MRSLSTPAPGVTRRSLPALHPRHRRVDYYMIEGGTHAWPGGKRIAKFLDAPSKAIDATTLIWQFFAAHPETLGHGWGMSSRAKVRRGDHYRP